MAILIGMNDRLFPTNFRPILEDIAFARANGFQAIQFHGKPDGLGESQLGASLAATGAALRDAGIAPVMEIVLAVDAHGQHESGRPPIAVLEANLPAITALGCTCVHWHVVLRQRADAPVIDALEAALVSQFAAGVALAAQHGFRFGVEHNAPEARPYHTAARSTALLDAVPGLGFVWDLNHTPLDELDAYLALARRMTMLHVADTALPETNQHVPLGLGNLDFRQIMDKLLRRGFSGPAILEIGGLPKSGGYGRDTDEALISSRDLLLVALV